MVRKPSNRSLKFLLKTKKTKTLCNYKKFKQKSMKSENKG